LHKKLQCNNKNNNFQEDNMKKYVLIAAAVIFAAGFAIGCGGDSSGDTELSFTNSGSSDGAISEIVWADGDAKWSGSYDTDATTESKTVSKNSGDVTCMVDTGKRAGIVEATVIFTETNSSSLKLEDGNKNNFTLTATSAR
jgi:hypothetical protein